MARRRRRTKRSRRSNGFKIPLALAGGVAGGLAHTAAYALDGRFAEVPVVLCEDFTGFSPTDGSFDHNRMMRGLFPVLVGVAVHKFVGGPPLNLNRSLARMPFISI